MNRVKILIFLIAICLFATGCAQTPDKDKPATTTPAHQKLIELCKNDYNLDIVTKAYANTLWIYLPINDPFLNITASKNGPVKSPDSNEKQSIKFLDGQFADNAFKIRYDIGPKKSYTDSKGIETKFSEDYTAKQQFLLGAITRAFSEVEKEPGSNRYVEKIPGDREFVNEHRDAIRNQFTQSYVKTADVPDFLVIIIADIKKGIEIRMYLYLQDLRRATRDPGFGEEYIKRAIMEQPIGHQVIIGDKEGAHLETYDLSWAEFLTKQMLYRINFKYTQSRFPPYPDTIQQLTEIAAETVKGYDFKEFRSIHFEDLSAGQTRTLSKEQLDTVEITPPNLPGKIHHLKFNLSSPEEDNEINY